MASFDDSGEDKSILDKLDSIAPLREFDAFPKVSRTYTTRTTLGGLATLLVILLSFLLSINDIGEFLWGWPDFEYSIDSRLHSTIPVNLDMVVNMPCQYISIDVRDAIGDRLHLTNSFTRDGTMFDARQAHMLHSHGVRQSTREIVTAAKKKSGGLFAALQSQSSSYRPTYNHIASGQACRIYGSVEVKRVTGNLHITSLGHGYASHEHTDHSKINFTHVISELSFGPYFPNIAQPLDYTFEVAQEPFAVFQYYATVVPTIYHAPRSKPVRTSQYSVTSYRRVIQHGSGSPGIFIKYEIDPVQMDVWQRTTSLTEFLLRLCGVVGGVWVCVGWALKVVSRAASVAGVSKDDDTIVDEAESAKLRKKASQRWGSDVRARSTGGWTIDGGAPASPGAPYTPYAPSTPGNTWPNGASPSPAKAGPYTTSIPAHVSTGPNTPPAQTYVNGQALHARQTSAQNGTPPLPSTPPREGSYGMPPSYSPSPTGGAAAARPKSGLNPSADKRID